MLWKDDCNDPFILLKGCEVYEYNKKILRLIVWKRGLLVGLQKLALFSTITDTDDKLTLCEVSRHCFDKVLAVFGNHKRRPNINGKYIKKLKIKLGHDIVPYRPELDILI